VALGGEDSTGSSGGPGGGPSGAPSFKNPVKGVESWLNALKSKDMKALKDASALRGQYEAKTETHRELFRAIQEETLPEEDLESLAKAFEGMKVQDANTIKSTGQVGIIVGKMDKKDRITRTLFVRKEKAGWKVVDFGAMRDFQPTIMIRGRNTGGRRR